MVLGGGPYFAYGIGGKTIHKLNDGGWAEGVTQHEWDTFGDGVFDRDREWLGGESLNRFDFGAGIQVGFVYQKYVLGAGGSASLIDIASNDRYESRLSTRCLVVLLR
jgi:hypothetical protein